MKQRLVRMTALIYVVCFIVTFLFSTMTHAAHAEHGHEYESFCLSTRMPECKCDNNDDQLQPSFLLNTQAAVIEEPHTHVDFGVACQTCALVCRAIDQLKQSSAAAGSAALTNINRLSFESLYLTVIQTVPLTPIELKTKFSN